MPTFHFLFPVRFGSSAHHTNKMVLHNVKFAASCCLCKASYNVTYLLSQWLCITYTCPDDCFQYSLNKVIVLWKYVRSSTENQQTLFEKSCPRNLVLPLKYWPDWKRHRNRVYVYVGSMGCMSTENLMNPAWMDKWRQSCLHYKCEETILYNAYWYPPIALYLLVDINVKGQGQSSLAQNPRICLF